MMTDCKCGKDFLECECECTTTNTTNSCEVEDGGSCPACDG